MLRYKKSKRKKNDALSVILNFLRRHILAIVVLLVFAVGTVATIIIVNREGDTNNEEEGSITILSPASESRIAMYNPRSFDPLASSDEDVVYLNQLIYGYLFRLDEGLNISPDLVNTYFPNRESGSVDITLRSGLQFSDGTPLTSSDVKFTIDTIKYLGSASPYFNYVNKISNVNLTGTNSFVIQFSDPNDAALDNLVFPIVSESLYNSVEFNLGAGPYKYSTYNPERNLELLPNERYHGTVPEVPVIINIVKNKDMLSGLVTMDDVTAYISSDPASDNIAEDKALRCRYIPSGELEYIGFNCNKAIFSDNKMRQAFAYAIDRNQIISDDYGGGVILSDSIYYPKFLGVEDEDPITYDPKKASELFASFGYSDVNEDKLLENPSGEPFTLRIIVSSESGTRKDAANTILNNLQAIGVSAEVSQLSPQEMTDALKAGDFDIYLAGIKIDKQFKISELFGSANYGNFNDQTVISLVGQLEQCLSAEEQKALFIALKPQLNNQIPYFSIGYKAYYFVSVPSLSVTNGPLFFDPYRSIGEWTWQKRMTIEE